jgi:hypothetical protein
MNVRYLPNASHNQKRTWPALSVTLGLLVAAAMQAGFISAVAALGAPPTPSRDVQFSAANYAAMDKMMAGMNTKLSGDVDRDFAAVMIPHHQGAIDMAQAELLYGRDEQLRRIAQEIIVEQQQEIAAMRLALGQSLSPSVVAPDQQLTVPADSSAKTMPTSSSPPERF